ncbi:uncharacterized protein LOC128234173 isoform X2 [Mya arenaria]|uniref:uncharacterized protein LOC128233913 isoform X2 n=1 Tax=Mya arenaria TaxID=6604 RepID=UPI0022DF4EB0|nr:uncharacterized protein LOC128233913 isoform X2 [Mya arenaria]XP_052804302.1 uncharacterized protein LOC128234173 isoform X2 [Mya arenaria]
MECPICLDRFTRPRALPCQHTLCYECLNQLIQGDRRVTCPECRAMHDVPSGGFPPNVAIQRLLDADQPPNVPQSNPSVRVSTVPTTRPISSRIITIDQDVVLQHIAAERQFYQDISPTPEMPGNLQSNRPEYVPSEGGCSIQCVKNNIERIRFSIRRLLEKFFRDHYQENTTRVITSVVFLVVTFSRFIASSVKLASSCDKEQDVAVYLFVKSILGFLFWIAILVLGYKGEITNAIKNPCFEIYSILNALFSFIWLIVGSAWCFGNYTEIKEYCPLLEYNWNYHFINFALFLTAVDWIILACFLFYALYTLCDDPQTEIS